MIGLVACGNSSGQNGNTTSIENEPKKTQAYEDEQKETQTPVSETGLNETEDMGDSQNDEPTGNNILVAYFSVTNNTKSIAQKIADSINADIYEIVPKEPYTDDDIDYNDKSSRSTIEMNNPDSRPEISGSVENMDKYDTIFIGYPIWWGKAPRIISTFMESYDFSGKKIIPFCTSASSGIDSSTTDIKKLAADATWLDGKRFSGSDSQSTVTEWVNGLNLSE